MNDKIIVHESTAKLCPLCAELQAEGISGPICPHCFHIITTKLDDDGRVICENCHGPTWFGVGEYND